MFTYISLFAVYIKYSEYFFIGQRGVDVNGRAFIAGGDWRRRRRVKTILKR